MRSRATRKNRFANPITILLVGFLVFFSALGAPAQPSQRVLTVTVFGDQGVMHGVLLATSKRVARQRTDSAGQCTVQLDEDQRDGSSLELTIVDPPGFEIKLQKPTYINAERSMKITLRRRSETPPPDIARHRIIEKTEIETKMKLIEVNTELATASFSEAVSFFKQRKYDEAVHALRIAVVLEPADPTYRRVLGMCLMELGQFDGAEDALKKARVLSYAQENGVGQLTRDIDDNLAEVQRRRVPDKVPERP